MYIATKLNLSVIFTLLECWLLTGTYSPSMIKPLFPKKGCAQKSHYLSQLIMGAASFFLRAVIFLISSILIPPTTPHHDNISTISDGFVVHLIHRDSPSSPFYDPNLSTSDRAILAANRSIARLRYLNSHTSQSLVEDLSPKLIPEGFSYIMMYNVGSPPHLIYAVPDTGSGLIWHQCLPCRKCFEQTSPIFDPSKSSTYNTVPSDSPACEETWAFPCGSDEKDCCYMIEYGDGGTSTGGTLSSDAFAFEDSNQNKVDVGHLVFGCSDYTIGTFKGYEAGVVGLNRDPHSLVSQLKIKKFSYCMVIRDDQGSGSRMYFGSLSVLMGGQTPFLQGEHIYYYVTLLGISVGDEKVPFPDGIFDRTSEGGGFIVDSGSEFTVLRSEAFNLLVYMLSKVIRLPGKQYNSGRYRMCFEGSFDELDAAGPDITFHFDGADVMLTKQTTYIEAQEGLWCLAMLPSEGLEEMSLLGSFQQMNYYVGYDLDAGFISFAPVDCAAS